MSTMSIVLNYSYLDKKTSVSLRAKIKTILNFRIKNKLFFSSFLNPFRNIFN